MSEAHKRRTRAMIAVMQAYIDGEEIEFTSVDGEWESGDQPEWDWTEFDYRIAPVTPDAINWSHVAPEFNYMARDMRGRAYLYSGKPLICSVVWMPYGSVEAKAESHASYARGTCRWQDSLVVRPGLEVAS